MMRSKMKTLGWMALSLLLLDSLVLAQDDVEPGWERSYQAGGTDVNGEFMGGSTIVHLVGHKGKLYAGNSYWLDANHYWYGGTNSSTPWAQVLRLDSPGGEWVEDLELGPNHLRVEILESVTFTADHQGNVLDPPVNLLVAAEYDSREPNVGISFWIRDDDTGTWAKTLVRSDPAQSDREVHSTRAIQVHRDRVTGIDRIFLGVGQIGIISGVYSPSHPNNIVWDATPETGAITWSANPPTGLLENRILSIIEANGDLLYSAGRKIYRRNDGLSPSYVEIEDVSDRFPASQNPLGGIRGMSAMPNPVGDGESIIFAMTESNQAPGWILRLDPAGWDGNRVTAYDRVEEGKLDDDMSDYLDGNPVYFILAAYNEFTPVVDPATLETVHLVGYESWIGGFQVPLWGADANGGFYRGGMYAIRDKNGHYRLMEVNGRSTETKPPLVAVCTIEISPFAEDGGNALYFGGHDGNHKSPSLNRNMAWIFRSSLKQALYGSTINAGRGDIPVHIPAGYDPANPAPLVILLHGYGGNGTSMAGYLDMAGLAEEYGFLYLSPHGTTEDNPNSDDDRRFWNATDACCNFYGSAVDDSSYLLNLISETKAQYSVDDERVFLVGLSNGGFMSHRMACDYPDVVSAIVSIAGATYKSSEACSAESPVRVLQIHGTNDDVIYYVGGDNFAAVYPGAEETVEKWAVANGCSLTSETSATQLDSASDVPGAETVITRYAEGCSEGGPVELWTIAGGSHVPALSATFSQNVVSWLFEEPYTVPNPTQTASPQTVASLGSTHDMATGTTNVTGAVCSPCGYQNLDSARIIDGATASIMPDDQYGYGDTEALGFSNFGFSIPVDNVIDGIAVTIAADVTTHVSGLGNTMLALTDDVTTAWGINSAAGIACELDLLNFAGSSPNNSGSGATGNEVGYPHSGTGLSSPYLTTGGQTNLWGSAETITPEMVNSPNFGLVIHNTAAAPGDVFEIDGVAMTIHHHSVDSYSLADAIMILMVLVGMDLSELIGSGYSAPDLDIDGDNRIGIVEAVYILQAISK